MVKLTVVGRVKDGLALAQGPRYVNEDNHESLSTYKQQAEFILKEISRGSLPPSNMTIGVDRHCFNFMVANGVCFLTLCDSAYPRKLAFHYLQDLQKEFEKLDMSLIDKITKPYSFVKLDGIIGNVRRQYIDTRTQVNLSKLNVNRQQELDIMRENMCELVERRRRFEMFERVVVNPKTVSPIWCSPLLEVIALKWIPSTIIVVAATVLLWTSLVLTDNFIETSL